MLAEFIAYTCVRFLLRTEIHEAVESDVSFNRADSKWSTNIGPNCTAKYSLRAVGAHEHGHTYGLEHVKEQSHGNLTMSGRGEICDDSPYTLGRGDLLGLRELY